MSPQRGEVDEAQRRRGENGAERRDRQDAERGTEVEERRHQGRGGHQARDLRAAADRKVDRGARIRGGDREGAEQPGGEVGGAEPGQLAVGVDGVAGLGAEAPGGDDAGAEAHEEDRGGAEQDGVDGQAREAGQRQRRQTCRDIPDHRDAVPLEVEQRRQQDRHHDHHHRTRHRKAPHSYYLQQDEHGHGEQERRQVDRSRLVCELDQGCEEALGLYLQPGHPADLPDQDRERHAGKEAGKDRPRQEGRENPEPQQSCEQVERPDRQRQHRGDADAVGLTGRGGEHGGQDARQHRHRRGIRSDDQLSRWPEDRIGDQRRDAGVEAGLGRQPGDCRIGDSAGQADRSDRQSCRDIAAQPSRTITAEAGGER